MSKKKIVFTPGKPSWWLWTCGDSYGWKSEYVIVHGLTQSPAFIVEGEPTKWTLSKLSKEHQSLLYSLVNILRSNTKKNKGEIFRFCLLFFYTKLKFAYFVIFLPVFCTVKVQCCYSEMRFHISMDRNADCLWRRHNCNWSLPFCADLLIYEINY